MHKWDYLIETGDEELSKLARKAKAAPDDINAFNRYLRAVTRTGVTPEWAVTKDLVQRSKRVDDPASLVKFINDANAKQHSVIIRASGTSLTMELRRELPSNAAAEISHYLVSPSEIANTNRLRVIRIVKRYNVHHWTWWDDLEMLFDTDYEKIRILPVPNSQAFTWYSSQNHHYPAAEYLLDLTNLPEVPKDGRPIDITKPRPRNS